MKGLLAKYTQERGRKYQSAYRPQYQPFDDPKYYRIRQKTVYGADNYRGYNTARHTYDYTAPVLKAIDQ